MSLQLSRPPSTRAAAIADDGTSRCVPAMRAVVRDLDRLRVALDEPITTVRRAALVTHVGFLVERARHFDGGPGSRPSATLSRLAHEARRWSCDPDRRAAMSAAVENATDALAGTTSPARPPIDPGRDRATADGSVVRLRDLPARRPTELAFHYFWLSDDLPPDLADELATGFSRPARWVLRNVLSGGYNRRAYLMWHGGGSGPAV